MKNFLDSHRVALLTAWKRLWRTPLGTALSLLVIALALTLPAGGLVLLDKATGLSKQASALQELNLFMQTDASGGETRQIESRLAGLEGIGPWRKISKETAWESMQKRPELADVLVGLPRNPLPDAFVVEVGSLSPKRAEALKADMTGWPKVAHVQLDMGWSHRLNAVLQLARTGIALLGLLFAVGLVAVVFNTIRAQVLAHASEIELSRLIGATDAFIRRPFVYTGVLQGGIGALLATGLLLGLFALLAGPAADLSRFYDTHWELGGLEVRHVLGLLCVGSVLGGFGARLSVALALRQMPA